MPTTPKGEACLLNSLIVIGLLLGILLLGLLAMQTPKPQTRAHCLQFKDRVTCLDECGCARCNVSCLGFDDRDYCLHHINGTWDYEQTPTCRQGVDTVIYMIISLMAVGVVMLGVLFWLRHRRLQHLYRLQAQNPGPSTWVQLD